MKFVLGTPFSGIEKTPAVPWIGIARANEEPATATKAASKDLQWTIGVKRKLEEM